MRDRDGGGSGGTPLLRSRKEGGPQVAAALLKHGVIGRAMPQGDILGFAPPLCLTRAEADTIVMATRDAIEEVATALRR